MPDKIPSPISPRRNTPLPGPVFIYDADCGFCAASVRWLLRRGAGARMDFCPCQQPPPEMAGLTDADCRRAAYVLAPAADAAIRVHRGAAAISFALRRLPGPGRLGWRLLGCLYGLPVLRQVGDAGYAWVARNRHRLLRSDASCSAP